MSRFMSRAVFGRPAASRYPTAVEVKVRRGGSVLLVAFGGGRVYGPDSPHGKGAAHPLRGPAVPALDMRAPAGPGQREAPGRAGALPARCDRRLGLYRSGGQVSGGVWPGDVFAVELSVLDALMKLPDQFVGQSAQRGFVGVANVPAVPVVGVGAR